jgi:hypothetical protein
MKYNGMERSEMKYIIFHQSKQNLSVVIIRDGKTVQPVQPLLITNPPKKGRSGMN